MLSALACRLSGLHSERLHRPVAQVLCDYFLSSGTLSSMLGECVRALRSVDCLLAGRSSRYYSLPEGVYRPSVPSSSSSSSFSSSLPPSLGVLESKVVALSALNLIRVLEPQLSGGKALPLIAASRHSSHLYDVLMSLLGRLPLPPPPGAVPSSSSSTSSSLDVSLSCSCVLALADLAPSLSFTRCNLLADATMMLSVTMDALAGCRHDGAGRLPSFAELRDQLSSSSSSRGDKPSLEQRRHPLDPDGYLRSLLSELSRPSGQYLSQSALSSSLFHRVVVLSSLSSCLLSSYHRSSCGSSTPLVDVSPVLEAGDSSRRRAHVLPLPPPPSPSLLLSLCLRLVSFASGVESQLACCPLSERHLPPLAPPRSSSSSTLNGSPLLSLVEQRNVANGVRLMGHRILQAFLTGERDVEPCAPVPSSSSSRSADEGAGGPWSGGRGFVSGGGGGSSASSAPAVGEHRPLHRLAGSVADVVVKALAMQCPASLVSVLEGGGGGGGGADDDGGREGDDKGVLRPLRVSLDVRLEAVTSFKRAMSAMGPTAMRQGGRAGPGRTPAMERGLRLMLGLAVETFRLYKRDGDMERDSNEGYDAKEMDRNMGGDDGSLGTNRSARREIALTVLSTLREAAASGAGPHMPITLRRGLQALGAYLVTAVRGAWAAAAFALPPNGTGSKGGGGGAGNNAGEAMPDLTRAGHWTADRDIVISALRLAEVLATTMTMGGGGGVVGGGAAAALPAACGVAFLDAELRGVVAAARAAGGARDIAEEAKRILGVVAVLKNSSLGWTTGGDLNCEDSGWLHFVGSSGGEGTGTSGAKRKEMMSDSSQRSSLDGTSSSRQPAPKEAKVAVAASSSLADVVSPSSRQALSLHPGQQQQQLLQEVLPRASSEEARQLPPAFAERKAAAAASVDGSTTTEEAGGDDGGGKALQDGEGEREQGEEGMDVDEDFPDIGLSDDE